MNLLIGMLLGAFLGLTVGFFIGKAHLRIKTIDKLLKELTNQAKKK